MAEGFVQVAPDSTGKSIDLSAIKIPAGSTITGSDGNTSVLTTDTIYYRQTINIGDPSSPFQIASVKGDTDKAGLSVDSPHLAHLETINETLQEMLWMMKLHFQDVQG